MAEVVGEDLLDRGARRSPRSSVDKALMSAEVMARHARDDRVDCSEPIMVRVCRGNLNTQLLRGPVKDLRFSLLTRPSTRPRRSSGRSFERCFCLSGFAGSSAPFLSAQHRHMIVDDRFLLHQSARQIDEIASYAQALLRHVYQQLPLRDIERRVISLFNEGSIKTAAGIAAAPRSLRITVSAGMRRHAPASKH